MIYLVDRYGPAPLFTTPTSFSEPITPPGAGAAVDTRDAVRAQAAAGSPGPQGAGLLRVDHITHNVHAGRMDHWARFYERLFGFRELRCFDIHGEKTGLRSRALISPCGKIRIPINEPTDPKSQIEEYLDAYRGEGISTSRSPRATSIERSKACVRAACNSWKPPTRTTP